jgi:lysophospholipase L1-like esterase
VTQHASQGSQGASTAGVRWIGRVDLRQPAVPRFAWSGSGFIAELEGTALVAELDCDDRFLFKAVVDGVPQAPFAADRGRSRYALAARLTPGRHRVELYRQTEGRHGDSRLISLTVSEGSLLPPPTAAARQLEVIGDSISAGYGVLGRSAHARFTYATESHWHTYAAVAARAVAAELSTIALSGHGLLRNHDGLGEPMPAYYRRAIPSDPGACWDPEPHPDAIVVALGTNDYILGDPGQPFVHAYAAFLATVRALHPDAWLLLATGPMLDDALPEGKLQWTSLRQHVYAVSEAFARTHDSRISRVEFEPNVDQFGCERHPNALKHASMGALLASELRLRLGW